MALGFRFIALSPVFSARWLVLSLMTFNSARLSRLLTCGDPDLATSRDIALAAIEAGADVIELGVPFSDPVADGPVIQRASERALRHGTSLQQVLSLAKEIRQRSKAGLIIFTYLNPIMRMGMAKFSATRFQTQVSTVL